MALTRRAWLIGGGSLLLAGGMPRSVSALHADDRVVGGHAFGTYWRLTLPADADHAAAVEAISKIVGSVNQTMSPFQERSEIAGFNPRPTTDWIEVSGTFQEVAAKSLRVSAVTNGAFDPTVGPIVGHRSADRWPAITPISRSTAIGSARRNRG